MPVVRILLGLVLAFFGRMLFWVFVAVVGFLLGVEFAAVAFADRPKWIVIGAGVLAGIAGAVLAVVIQRLAFGIVGFYAGGLLALTILHLLEVRGQETLGLVVGGVIGAVIAVLLADWAVIALTALAGAATVASSITAGPRIRAGAFLAVLILGVVVQGRQFRS